MNPPTLAEALAQMSEVWTSIVDMISNNIWLLTFLAAGLLRSGFKLFKRARKSVGA